MSFVASIMRRARASLAERARYYSSVQQTNDLARKNGIAGGWQDGSELLQTILSVKAILEKAPPVLIDVGAHKGAFSRAADQILGFERIICVEPDSDLIAQLTATTPVRKTTIYQTALSDAEGELDFFIHTQRTMNSLLPVDIQVLESKFKGDDASKMVKRMVKVTTLDKLLAAEQLNGELFLKLDTQGNERQILAGAIETLARTSACLIEYMFCTPYRNVCSFEELVVLLKSQGFVCKGAMAIQRRPNHEVSAVDFLFVRPTVAKN